ncbi:hypothetical protein BDC45DRAFT_542549 [Circinella umbellata]|nr:hypothetical protein BDC45DRAFT_542549 [Circinella umbellata]
MKDCELCDQLVPDRDYREHKRRCYEQLRATVSNDTQTTYERTNDASQLQPALLEYDQWEDNTEYDYGDLDQTSQDGYDASDDESILSEDEHFETYFNNTDTIDHGDASYL